MDSQSQSPEIIHHPIYNPQPISVPPCTSKYYKFKIHKCKYCDFRSDQKHVVKRHTNSKHEKNKKKGTVIQLTEPVIDGGDGNAEENDPSEKIAYNIQLEPNFKMFISGPSSSGKTHFTGQLLANLSNITKSTPTKIVYVFKRWQEKLQELKDLNLVDVFLQGGGDLDERLQQILAKSTSTLIIFDDMIGNKENLEHISILFAMGRHSNLSLIFISQKIFHNLDSIRMIRENSDYYVLFKNPKNMRAISYLGGQLSVNSTLVADIYSQATQKPHSYLFCNVTQQGAATNTQYLTDIFTRDHIVTTFVIDSTMNKYKKSTTFQKMFLVSAEKLQKMESAGELRQETETNEPLPEDEENIPSLNQSVKRKLEDQDTDQDEPDSKKKREIQPDETLLSTSVPLPTTPSSPPPTTAPTVNNLIESSTVSDETSLPQGESTISQPSVESEDNTVRIMKKRDIGAGRDQDAELAAEREVGVEVNNNNNNNNNNNSKINEVQSETNPSVSQQITTAKSPFPHTCEICGKSVKSAKGLKVHKSRLHYDSDQQGTLQGDSSTSQPLVAGMKRKRSLVDETTGTRNSDEIDIEDVARKKARVNVGEHCVCKICNKHFRSKRLYDQHVLTAHVNVEASELDNVMEDEDEILEEKRNKSNIKKAALNRKILSKKLKLKQQANVNSDSEEDKENTTTIVSTNNTTEKRKKFSKKKNSDKASDALTEKSGQLCNLCQTKFSSEAHLKQHFISVHQQR